MGNSWNKIINDLSNDPQSQLFTQISNLPDTITVGDNGQTELYKIIMTVPESYSGVIASVTKTVENVKKEFDTIDLLQRSDNQLITDIRNLKSKNISLQSSHLDYFIQKLNKYIDVVNRKNTNPDRKEKYLKALNNRIALITNLKSTIDDEILGSNQGVEESQIYNNLKTVMTSNNSTTNVELMEIEKKLPADDAPTNPDTLSGGGYYRNRNNYHGNQSHKKSSGLQFEY